MNQTESPDSTHSATTHSGVVVDGQDANYLTNSTRSLTWAMTLDHKRISIMYLVAILATFFIGLQFAMAMRVEISTADPSFMSPDAYNRIFTLHGAIMVFLVVIPAIPAVFGNFVLPLMLGAKGLAFPRLNLASFYLYVLGAVLFLVSMLQNGLDTGWTFAIPYVTQTEALGVIPVLLGAIALGVSSIFQGINFIATIHRLRPPGMTWFRMPLFSWSLYCSSIIQVLTTPTLVIVLGLLIAERTVSVGLQAPDMEGGDPVLYQRFFWFFAAPAMFVMILPAMGVISELISVHSRKPIFGYRVIVYCFISITLLSFVVWGRHFFTGGQSGLVNTIFSLLIVCIALPMAIIVFNWLATMSRGAIAWNTPMVFAMIFICLVTIGGLSGLFLSSLATDIHLHGTMFEAGHLHYLMMGGVLTAFFAGLHHWWPKMTGRIYDEHVGLFCAFVILVSFNVTFFPQFIMGSRGLPRHYLSYPVEFEALQKISTIGSVSLGLAFFIIAAYLIYSFWSGPKAASNPWGASTLDWRCSSPPPYNNFEFEQPPRVGAPYDYSDLDYDASSADFVIASSQIEARPDTFELNQPAIHQD